MKRKLIPVLAACLPLAAGCAGDSMLDPASQSAPSSNGQFADNQNLAVSGAGLFLQPSRVRITVPVQDPADILQATFYWVGRGPAPDGDGTIDINGVILTGTLIGSRNVGGAEPWVSFHKLDGLGIVTPGTRDYIVAGFDPGSIRRGGIALAVVYRDPTSPWARVRTVEPLEIVQWDMAGRERGNVWSFPIEPTTENRLAKLTIVTADCEAHLPDRIWWEAGAGSAPAGDLVGATPGLYTNLLRSAFGPWLDVLVRPNLLVPAGSGHFAYQIESPAETQNGDSIVHLFGAVMITGDQAPCAARIGDRVWEDQDGDGIQDAGEPGLPGVTVTLLDATGASVAQRVTDAQGNYEFAGLCAGDYTVDVATPAGFEPAPCDMGADDNFDSECSPAPVTVSRDSEPVPTVDFGFTEFLPPLAPGCYLGVGFWKHQFNASLDDKPGNRHFSDEELTMLLDRAARATAMRFGGDDDVISFEEAVALLSKGGRNPCGKAYKHYLALLLNFAANGSNRAVGVDTNGDGSPDNSFGSVIDAIEALLAVEDADDCRTAAALAESANETPSHGCTL